MPPRSVEILMATFNGEACIAELLASIVSQSHPHWTLRILDDQSTDATPKIIREFQHRFPEKVSICKSPSRNLGPAAAFAELIRASTSDTLMLCDQDDVWLPEKIQYSIENLEKEEHQHTTDMPLLLHTDLIVTDGQLNILDPSFRHFQKLDPASMTSLPKVLIQNSVTGCTCIFNRALANLITSIPREAIMHDWWLALTAAAFGKIIYLPKATLLYRQHSANNTGAKHWDLTYILRKISEKGNWGIDRILLQGKAFRKHFNEHLDSGKQKTLQQFCSLSEYSFFRRRTALLKNGFFKHGFIRNIALFFKI